ncbi:MAG: beta-propeller fold lactonase family protein, partial [Rhodospirillales bacterium]|nr:beta-propeller fold lactonase family protein [Acetobacter sp.]
TGTSNATSINNGGNYVFVTDAGSNQIVQYTVGTSCALSTVVGGSVPNIGGTANPVNAIYVAGSSSNNYLYVINQSTTDSTQVNSSISAFTVTSTGQLQEVSDPKNNPYSVGSAPACIVEDPSSKYIYTANNGDGTVTGKIVNKANGQLANLPRGTNFNAVGKATCLAVTGSIG